MRGRLDVREIEDLGDDVIGFAELKAIASGDPPILEKAKLDAEAERLNRVHRAWQRGHHALRSTITAGQERAGVRERKLAAVNQALPRVRDTRGDLFTITINDRSYAHRTDAASALATRQLEHRVQTLPDLAARLDHERIEALRETAAARDQLARPFKYADQLAVAHRQREHIAQQIAERHHEHQDVERTAAIAGVDADTAASIALAHRDHPNPPRPPLNPPPPSPPTASRQRPGP